MWGLSPRHAAVTLVSEVKGTPVSPINSDVAHLRARHAGLRRHSRDDDPAVVAARQELKAASIEAYLERQIAEAPPLTNEQRAKLAELLEPVRIKPKPVNKSRRSA